MPERKVKVSDDKCWVTVAQTVNLGNYESLRIEMGFSKTHGKKDPVDTIDKMYNELEKKLEKKVSKIKPKTKRNKRR